MLLVKANVSLFSYSAFLVLEIKLWNWNIVPLAMFYFSIDSEIKTSESAPKCRLFLWTFLQSVTLSTCDMGGADLLENSLYVHNQYGNVTVEILKKQMRLLGYFCQLPTTLQPKNNQIFVRQFFEIKAEKICSFWTPSLWHSQRCRQLSWMKCLLQVRYRFRGL